MYCIMFLYDKSFQFVVSFSRTAEEEEGERPLVGSQEEHGTIVGMCWFHMAQDKVRCHGLWTGWEHGVP
jgi:hypothetical protein